MARTTTDPPRPQDAKTPEFVQRGKVLIVRKQFQEAVKICRLGLLAHPTFIEGRLVLGMALMALARYDEVLAEVRVAMELEPDNAIAYLLKGEALYHKRDFTQAKEVLLRAHELNPLNLKISKLLAELEDIVDYGPEAGPRNRTETKVYPAQRAQAIHVPREPSEVLVDVQSVPGRDLTAQGQAGELEESSADEEPEEEGEPEEDEPTEPDPEPVVSMRAKVEDDDEVEEEYTTAPFLPPTHMVARQRTVEPPDWERDQTYSDDAPPVVDDTEQRKKDTLERALESQGSAPGSPLSPFRTQPSRPGGLASFRTEPSPAEPLPLPSWDTSDVELATMQEQREADEEDEEDWPEEEPTEHEPGVGVLFPADGGTRERGAAPEEEPTALSGEDDRGFGAEDEEDAGERSGEGASGAEEEETVVNADAPPPEALFGEGEALLSSSPSPRSSADPTKAVDLSREGPLRPRLSPPVESVRGLAAAPTTPAPLTALPSRPLTAPPLRPLAAPPSRPLSALPSRPLTASSLAAPLGAAPTATRGPARQTTPPLARPGTSPLDLEESRPSLQRPGTSPMALQPDVSLAPMVVEPSLERPLGPASSLGSGRAPPSASEVRYVSGVEVSGVDVPGEAGSFSDLSDLSVEMIPDELEMPPVPTDARAQGQRGSEPLPLPPAGPVGPIAAVRSEEDESATRVNFDAPEGEAEDAGAAFDFIPARTPPPAPLAPQPSYNPLAREASYDPLAPEPSYDPLAREASYDPLVPEPPYDPLAREPSYDPLAPQPSYNPLAPEASYDPLAPEASYNPLAREASYDPLAREASYDPLAREPSYDPLAPEPSYDPLAAAPSDPLGAEASYGEQSVSDYDAPSLGREPHVVDVPPPAREAAVSFDPAPAYQPPPAPPYRAPAGRRSAPFRPLGLPDEDDEVVEPAESAEPEWAHQPPRSRTAALDQDDGRVLPYEQPEPRRAPPRHEPTMETSPGSPKGIRGGPEHQRRASAGPSESVVIEEPADSGLFRQRAATESRPGKKHRAARRPPSAAEKTSTSFLTLLMGEPGSHRGLILLGGAVAVLAAAVGIGLAVRYLRLGEQIEGKRKQAIARLHAGNLPDYMAAAQSYADILARRSADVQAQWAHARIQAAIPFEFGDPNPQAYQAAEEGEEASADRIAADVYANLHAGALDRAAALLERSRNAHSENPLLHYLAGRVRMLEGNAGEAERQLELAGRLEPKDTLYLRALAEAMVQQGRVSEALEKFRAALAINPNHVGTLLGKAHAQVLARTALADADRDLTSIVSGPRRQVASRGQRGWAYLIQAQLAVQQGQLERCRGLVSQARSNTPARDPVFQDELAGVLIDSFQLGEAEKAVQESKRLMKGRPQPSYFMAQIHLRNGLPEQALAELAQAKNLNFAASALLRAQIHLDLNELRKATEAVEQALQVSRDLLDAYIIKARVLAASQMDERAESLLRSLLEKNPRNARLLTALGEVYISARKYPLAYQRLRQALEVDRLATDAQLKLAQLYETEGKHADAKRSLVEASRSNLGNVSVLKELARLEADTGDLNEAATNYQKVLTRIPNDAGTRLALARVLTLQRDLDGAQRELREAEQHRGEPSALALARGRLALARGQAQDAMAHLGRAGKSAEAWDLLVRARLEASDEAGARQAQRQMVAALGAGQPECELTLARVEHAAGQLRPAIRSLRAALDAIAKRPRPPVLRAEVQVLLGRVLQDAGDGGRADAEYRGAAATCPACADPLYYRGLLLDERGAADEAQRSLEKAVELDPRKSEAFYWLGQVHERAGNAEKARAAYTRCLALHPSEDIRSATTESLNNLGKE